MTDEPRLPDIPDAVGPPVRISDVERTRAVEFLRHHCADGRLTLDEFSDRVGVVFEAKTVNDLDTVISDLPEIERPVHEAVAAAAPGSRKPVSRFTLSIMGGWQRRGRWRLEGTHTVVAFMGGCQLDMRGAEIVGDEVVITIFAFMGGAQVVVPEGVEVELTGFSFMGGKSQKINESVPRIPGAPVIRVRAFSFMGGVSVQSRPSKAARAVQQARRDEYRAARDAQRQAVRSQRDAQRQSMRAEREQMKLAADQLKHKVVKEIREQVERAVTSPPPARGGSGRAVGPGPVPPPFASPDRLREWLSGMATSWDSIRTQMPPEGTVTILFSDIEGFTALNHRIGDRAIQEVLHDHNAIVRGQLAAHGGFEVKSQGDGFMIAFASATRAIRCAVGIQRELRAYNRTREEQILVRMGLHTGDTIREANDFLGTTVNLAARIADQAAGGQILVSGLLHDLCASGGEFVFDEGADFELKGLEGGHRLHTVKWE